MRAIDPSLAVLSIDPLRSLIRDSINQDLLVSRVVSFFGALALILTALGLYGVMTYNTARRVSEFGLRIALGAKPGDVMLMMLREAMLLLLGGVVLGVPTALAATRLLRGQLFGIGVIDAPSLLVSIAVLAVSAAVAGGLPALRAARSSPLTALNTE
jgi:ABC-type antimicrobial peptide transport system permease subunit